jgi:hypothetical protein
MRTTLRNRWIGALAITAAAASLGVTAAASKKHDGNTRDGVPSVAAGRPATADRPVTRVLGVLALGDDDFVEVALPFDFPFCGTTYASVFVGSNGYVTFGAGDTDFAESVSTFLAGPPRIAALWDDLNPTSAGTITVAETTDGFAVTWNGVPAFPDVGANTFTITLEPDGRFNIAYTIVTLERGLVGRTLGGGAADPGEVDLSSASSPIGTAAATVYEIFSDADNDLSGLTLAFAPCPGPAEVAVFPAALDFAVPLEGFAEEKLTLVNPGGVQLDFATLAVATPASAVTEGSAVGEILPLLVSGRPAAALLSEATQAKLEAEQMLEGKPRPPVATVLHTHSAVALPHLYSQPLLLESFDTGFPGAWASIDKVSSGLQWGLASDFGRGNFTGSAGDAACADSDAFGPAEIDTELRTPVIVDFGINVVLSYTVNYQNYAQRDFLDVDLSTDGGATWTTLLSWNDDHGAFLAPPGEMVTLALDPYLANASEFMIRWHYYDPLPNDYDWYVQIDDVQIVSDEPCPWLAVTPAAGSVFPGGFQELTASVDASGMVAGSYDCDLLVQSNAANSPRHSVPVVLEVIEDLEPPVVTCRATPVTCRPGGPNPRGGGEYDPEDEDYIGCLRVHFGATDESDFTLTAIIDDGCQLIPVVTGDIFHRRCGDEDEDAGAPAKPKCKPRQAVLLVTATDEFGNTGTCELDLCDLYPEGERTARDPVIFGTRSSARGAVIEYRLTAPSYVRLTVYNVMGRRVEEVGAAKQPAGHYHARWDPKGAANGIYLYRLEYAGVRRTGKIVLVQ